MREFWSIFWSSLSSLARGFGAFSKSFEDMGAVTNNMTSTMVIESEAERSVKIASLNEKYGLKLEQPLSIAPPSTKRAA